jgi:hypothetical protein
VVTKKEKLKRKKKCFQIYQSHICFLKNDVDKTEEVGSSSNDGIDKTKETGYSCNNDGVSKSEETGCTSIDVSIDKSKETGSSSMSFKCNYDKRKFCVAVDLNVTETESDTNRNS